MRINVDFGEGLVDNYGGKNRLILNSGKEILLEGDIPTVQELKDNGLLEARWYDADEGGYTKDLSAEGFEIDVLSFDRDVPGFYAVKITYTDSDTGNVYEDYDFLMYYFNEEEGFFIRSDAVTRK